MPHKKIGIGILFPGASASELSKYKDFVFSLSADRYVHAKHTVKYFKNKHPKIKPNILVVIKKESIFSLDIYNNLLRVNKEQGNPIQLTPIYFSEENANKAKFSKKILNTGFQAIYITPYASESKNVYKQLIDKFQTKVPFYVSGAWLSIDRSIMNDIPKKYKIHLKAFSTTRMGVTSRLKSKFYDRFSKDFGHVPEREAFSGYKLGYAVSDILKRTKQNNPQSALQSLVATGCFIIEENDKICRDQSGFAIRDIAVFQWTSNGFKELINEI